MRTTGPLKGPCVGTVRPERVPYLGTSPFFPLFTVDIGSRRGHAYPISEPRYVPGDIPSPFTIPARGWLTSPLFLSRATVNIPTPGSERWGPYVAVYAPVCAWTACITPSESG